MATLNNMTTQNNSSRSYSTADKISSVLGGLATIGTTAYKTYGDVLDSKNYINRGYSYMLRPLLHNDSYDNLRNDYLAYTPLSYVNKKDLGYSSSKGLFNTLSSAGSGAAAGAAFGGIGAGVGAVIGGLAGGLGWLFGSNKASREMAKVNNSYSNINDYNGRMLDLRYSNLRGDEDYNLAYNSQMLRGMGYANGGTIKTLNNKVLSPFGNRFYGGGPVDSVAHSNGIDWRNGLTIINNGGSHEQNLYGGVPISVDSQGVPNLVEEGEAIYDSPTLGTFAFSERLFIPKEERKALGLPVKKNLESYANAVINKYNKTLKQRPNDPIERRGFEAFAQKAAESLERNKKLEEQRQMQEQIPMLGITNIAALGGPLNISNKLLFPNIYDIAGPIDTMTNTADSPVYRWLMGLTPELYADFVYNAFPEEKISGWKDWSEGNIENFPSSLEFWDRAFAKGRGPVYNAILNAYNNRSNTLETSNNSTPATSYNKYVDYINKKTDSDFNLWVIDNNIDVLLGLPSPNDVTKQAVLNAVSNTERGGAIRSTIDTIGNKELGEVVVKGSNKWTNLGKSTRKYDKDKKPIPYKWEKNGLTHKDVREHLANAFFGGTAEQRQLWVELLREKAKQQYLKENPDDKKLKNFVDPTANYLFNDLNYDIPNKNATWLYEGNNSNLTDEERQLLIQDYRKNEVTLSNLQNGIYTDNEGNIIPFEDITDDNRGDYNWNPVNALDILTDPVTGEIHYDTSLGEDVLNNYNYDFNTTKSKFDQEKPYGEGKPGLEYLRFLSPVANTFNVLGDILGDNNPDYRTGNELRNSVPLLDVPAYQEIQDYIAPQPFARDYYTNLYLANSEANRRGIISSVGGNRNNAIQLLHVSDLNTLNKIGELGRAAEEYNRKDYLSAREYNRRSKEYDADSRYKYNQLAFESGKAKQDVIAKAAAADLNDDITASQRRSDNWNSWIEDWTGVGNDARNWRMTQMLINAGVFGTTPGLGLSNWAYDYDNWKRDNSPNITILQPNMRSKGGIIRRKYLTLK